MKKSFALIAVGAVSVFVLAIGWRIFARDPAEGGGRQHGPFPQKRVTFWGRVVDQSGTPVRDAIARIEGVGTTGSVRLSTDRDGFFRVESFDNRSLSIYGVAKADYYQPPLFTPLNVYLNDTLRQGLDRKNPVIFRLFRKQGEYEGLLRLERKFFARSDSRPFTIDLLKGTTSEAADATGDFRVTFVRPASLREKAQNYDWSATIEATDGGFAPFPADTDHLSWAPKDGYSPQLQWTVKGSDPKWADYATTKAFFRSRNGQVYGVVTSLGARATWDARQNGLPFIVVTGVLNPNHSRNLQRGDATVFNVFDTMEAVARFNPRTAREETARWLAGAGQRVESAASLPNVYTVPRPLTQEPPALPAHDFYGKAVDEKGEPVADANVQIQVGPLMRRPPEFFKAVSDGQGILKIPALPLGNWPVRGPDKEGYLGDPAFIHHISFGVPGATKRGMSLADPEVWRLWKKIGPPQPLLSELIVVKCPSDGTPVRVDLLMDTPWAGVPIWAPKLPVGKPADLKLSITRSAEDKFMVRKPWSYSIEAPSGGMVETGDSLMYFAPEAGYKPKIEASGQRKWSIEKRLFLKTRDGKMYGSVLLTVSAIGRGAEPSSLKEMRTFNPPGEVQIHVALNPTGSRSLEPDPKRTYKSYNEYLKAEKQK